MNIEAEVYGDAATMEAFIEAANANDIGIAAGNTIGGLQKVKNYVVELISGSPLSIAKAILAVIKKFNEDGKSDTEATLEFDRKTLQVTRTDSADNVEKAIATSTNLKITFKRTAK